MWRTTPAGPRQISVAETKGRGGRTYNLPDPTRTGFSLDQLRFIDGDPAFPGTAHVGIRRFGEIPTHFAHLFADVPLFRTSVSANVRFGQGALCLYHVLTVAQFVTPGEIIRAAATVLRAIPRGDEDFQAPPKMIERPAAWSIPLPG